MIIVVTGTPGTGKTTFSKKLAKETGAEYLDVSELIKDKNLSEGYDEERQCEIIDTDRLVETILKVCSDGRSYIVDSHLSHYLPPAEIKICIVTKCGLKELRSRLEARGYKESKIKENMEAEIFDVCRIEALESGHKVLVVETDKDYDVSILSATITGTSTA